MVCFPSAGLSNQIVCFQPPPLMSYLAEFQNMGRSVPVCVVFVAVSQWGVLREGGAASGGGGGQMATGGKKESDDGNKEGRGKLCIQDMWSVWKR